MSYEYLNGLETEIAKLRDFPVKVEKNVIRGAVRAGAVEMKKAIGPLVPVKTGALLGTLRVSTRISRGSAIASVKIGNIKRGVFYAGMVMGGTKPHLIQGREGGLAFLGIVRKAAHHPGSKANAFMDRASVSARDRAIAAIFGYADERTRELLEEQGNQ